MNGKNPNNTQKKAFSTLSQCLPILCQFGAFAVNLAITGFFIPLNDEIFTYFQELVKVGGVFMSRAGLSDKLIPR